MRSFLLHLLVLCEKFIDWSVQSDISYWNPIKKREKKNAGAVAGAVESKRTWLSAGTWLIRSLENWHRLLANYLLYDWNPSQMPVKSNLVILRRPKRGVVQISSAFCDCSVAIANMANFMNMSRYVNEFGDVRTWHIPC